MEINQLELRRKIFHILTGVIIIFLILFVPFAKEILVFLVFFGLLMSFLCTKLKIPGFYHALCLLERKCNKDFPGAGLIWFVLGSWVVLVLFPLNIAIASILILTFGDSISHFIGSNFGKFNILSKGKNIEGTIVGIIFGTLAASLVISPLLAFLGCFVAMIFELAEIYIWRVRLDDNLLIPLISGVVIYLFSLVV
jgi:dolichol kinase